jgi:hypothetical protein
MKRSDIDCIRRYKFEIALIFIVIALSCIVIGINENISTKEDNLSNYFWMPSSIMQSVAAIYALFIAILVLSIQNNQKTVSLIGSILKPRFKITTVVVAITIYFNGLVLFIFSHYKPIDLEVSILYFLSLVSLFVSLIAIVYTSFWMVSSVAGLNTDEETLYNLNRREKIKDVYLALDFLNDQGILNDQDYLRTNWSLKSTEQQNREIQYIIRILKNGTSEMKINLATFVCIIKDERASEQLIENLNDDDPIVAARSTLALGCLQIERARDKISKNLYHSHPEVREKSAIALHKIDKHDALIPLILKLDKLEYYGFVTRTIVNILGDIEDKLAVEAIIKKLDDPEKTIRWAAAEALGKIGGERAEEELTRRLNSNEETLRKAAEKALKMIRKRMEK